MLLLWTAMRFTGVMRTPMLVGQAMAYLQFSLIFMVLPPQISLYRAARCRPMWFFRRMAYSSAYTRQSW